MLECLIAKPMFTSLCVYPAGGVGGCSGSHLAWGGSLEPPFSRNAEMLGQAHDCTMTAPTAPASPDHEWARDMRSSPVWNSERGWTTVFRLLLSRIFFF